MGGWVVEYQPLCTETSYTNGWLTATHTVRYPPPLGSPHEGHIPKLHVPVQSRSIKGGRFRDTVVATSEKTVRV